MRMPELLVIMAILVLLFGATRLPALGSSLGSAIRNFKRGFSGDEADVGDKEKPTQAALSDTGPSTGAREQEAQAQRRT